MAYSVDWIAKVVSIPNTDLTLVSGSRYQLNMFEFLIEIRRLEAAFSEGLWAPQIVVHDNTRLDFAGADYAPFDDIINGYTIEFTGPVTRVDLIGSNNNLIDVLIANGVSVVPSNSAGLIVKSVGSGLSAEQDAKLSLLAKVVENKKVLLREADGIYLVIYDDDGTTPIVKKPIKDMTGSDLVIEDDAMGQELQNIV